MSQAKNMSYSVDLVSEDSFYENMLLGVTKLLESHPRVCKVMVNRRQPCERAAITNWEQKHSVPLPEDLRNFYASTDGFLLRWSYKYSAEEILPVGIICVNSLSELILSSTVKELLDIAQKKPEDGKRPALNNTKSKVLELGDCRSFGKVCLILTDGNWSIWLLTNTGTWHWLANSFTNYFRMAIVHLGLPSWQAAVSEVGVLPWAEQLYNLLAPHLLHSAETQRVESPEVLNKIDSAIFKTPSKHFASRSNAANRQSSNHN